MRPDASSLIDGALRTLAELMADEPDEQRAGRLRSVATVLALLRTECETGAASRSAVGDLYREILERGSALQGAGRGDAVRQALATLEEPASLAVSELEARLDTLRAAIGELETWLEGSSQPGASELLVALRRAEYADARSRDRHAPFW